jgi:hypothetical protein
MQASGIAQALNPLTEALDSLGIRYYLVGSVASSAYGTPRTTLDVDMVAEISASHVQPLVKHLGGSYYIDPHMILDAINRQSTFNLVHLATMVKVDVFVARSSAYQAQVFGRVRWKAVEEGPENAPYNLSSPEDVLIGKLVWYEQGGRVSERQWKDIVGVIRVQGGLLDSAYLRRWCRELSVTELLELALREAEHTP